MEATTSYNSGTITVSASITIYGPGATSALAQRWQNAILQKWNNQGQYFQYGNCKVVFNVAVSADPNANWFLSAASNPNFPTGAQNFIYVPSGDDVSTGVNFATRSNGTWWRNASDQTVAHETGHLFGLGDDYWPFSDPPKPYSGHKNHMMADNGDHTIVQHEIDGIVSSVANWWRCKCHL